MNACLSPSGKLFDYRADLVDHLLRVTRAPRLIFQIVLHLMVTAAMLKVLEDYSEYSTIQGLVYIFQKTANFGWKNFLDIRRSGHAQSGNQHLHRFVQCLAKISCSNDADVSCASGQVYRISGIHDLRARDEQRHLEGRRHTRVQDLPRKSWRQDQHVGVRCRLPLLQKGLKHF